MIIKVNQEFCLVFHQLNPFTPWVTHSKFPLQPDTRNITLHSLKNLALRSTMLILPILTTSLIHGPVHLFELGSERVNYYKWLLYIGSFLYSCSSHHNSYCSLLECRVWWWSLPLLLYLLVCIFLATNCFPMESAAAMLESKKVSLATANWDASPKCLGKKLGFWNHLGC